MFGHASARRRTEPVGASARAAILAGLFAALAAPLSPAAAQYFGRNKVNYETFDFRVVRTPTWDVHYYPAESTATVDMARAAERWYARLRPFLRHQFNERKSIIFFADQPDFQQNNVTTIESEGTGGVTESARQRVVMPHTGSYFDTHHVLGHEIVHVFQYDIAQNMPTGGGNAVGLNALPLWLVEGMAEYLSLGRDDSNTAMWLRDAARRKDIPTIRQLTTDPRYFPYRYGQALWAYVGGRYGDQAVVDVYRTSLRAGFEGAIRRVLDVSTEQLSKEWAAAINDAYLPLLGGRTAPDSTGTVFLRQRARRGGEYNIAPALSPDGRRVAFYSSRDLFGIEVYIADVETGRVINQLGSVNTPRHFDALSFIQTAGSWSPDGRQLAYVVYREGNQQIELFDVDRGRAVKRLRTPNIGTATDPAWSPDGRYVAFVGNVGGISDLYLYDLQADTYTQLTRGREAEIQPSWSPDGRSLVFVTDRGPQTDFERFTFGPMRLAAIDVASREVRLLPPAAPGAKHVNPRYSPDGRSVFFVSDRTGFSDVYRMDLASGELFQVTNTATGVSGISAMSPALDVARESGRVVFSVFDRGGYHLARLDDDARGGRSVGTAGEAGGATQTPGVAGPPAAALAAPGGTLPPFTRRFESVIERYLAEANFGLPRPDTTLAVADYRANLRLDYIAPPTFAASTGGPFGTQFGGGIAAQFSDQLGNRNLVAVLSAQGDIQDIGGQLQYINVRQRWNWGVLGGHIAYPYAFQYLDRVPPDVPQRPGDFSANTVLQRIYIDQLGALAQYPFSPTRRVEFQVSATRQSIRQDVYAVDYDQLGNPIRERRDKIPSPSALGFAQATAALVGDYSIFGFTSPIAGGRYRFDLSPSIGEVAFTNAIADYRRYFLARPVTFAFRGMHYGRYGRDSENQNLLYPLFLGFEQWVRGYDYNSFTNNECRRDTGCPAIERLFGSRVAIASAELRIPLLGVEGLGLIRTNLLPVEIAPFVDAGVAWGKNSLCETIAGRNQTDCDSSPDLRFVTGREAATTFDRIPVVSAGVSARFNLFGYAVVEAYYAYPFQRPDKGAHFGFQLAPGW
jgi:hypothetical protein